MARHQGLVIRTLSQRAIRRITVAAWVLLVLLHTGALLTKIPLEPLAVHSLTLILIALATYSWMVCPLAVGVTISVVSSVSILWSWAVVRSHLLGSDLVAALVLFSVAGVQQHRRQRRLHRLKQQTSDLDEETYLKSQELRASQHARDALQRKLARYQQLQTVAQELSRVVDLETICQLAVDRTFELIGKSDAGLLLLVDKERQELALSASRKHPQVPAIRAKLGDQFDRYVLRTQRPLLVNDVRRDFRFTEAAVGDRAVGSVIACPMRVAQNVEGVLRVDNPHTGIYTQDDLRFLDILLDLIGTAIANARLFSRTQQLALTDGLTGLYRRQPLLDQLAREVARATRARESMALLMLDIDDFKRHNDTFGHTAGDAILKAVADRMRALVSDDGMCARYGGEEFAILLPKSSRPSAVDLANRIRQEIARTVHAGTGGPHHAVTVSIGVASFPEDTQLDTELLRVADQRLYRAKRAGKNCVWSS